jgi:hypothetical protein
MKKIINPFIVLGYQGPEYFCDREKETIRIVDAIESNRNVNLMSIRRLGKTALIYHVYQHLDIKKFIPIYIDLEYTHSQTGLLERFSEKISHVLHDKDKNFLRKLTRLAGMVGASISMDPYSGMPKLEFGLKVPEDTTKPLIELLRMLTELKQYVILALDEFQQIVKFPEKNTEGLLRSLAQQFPSIRFIYAGSSLSVMNRLFMDPERAFYQSAQHIELGYIPETSYREFILRHFNSRKVKITLEEVDELLNWCKYHTFYVQYFCNRLFSLRKHTRGISLNDIKKELLEENKNTFISYLNLIKTRAQLQLLKSIAKHITPVRSPLSHDFVRFAGLSSATIQSGLIRLKDNHLIFRNEEGYQVYHVFFSRFLELLK